MRSSKRGRWSWCDPVKVPTEAPGKEGVRGWSRSWKTLVKVFTPVPTHHGNLSKPQITSLCGAVEKILDFKPDKFGFEFQLGILPAV